MGLIYDKYGYTHDWVAPVLFILIIILAIFLLAIIIIAITYPLERYSCQQTANRMSVEWDYGIWIPCMYKINNRWVDSDNYQEIQGVIE